MGDADDAAQNVALGVVAGVVALVIAGLIALVIASSGPRSAAAVAGALPPVAAEVVVFDVGVATLSAETQLVLARVADAARAEAGAAVLISAFHDVRGDAAANAALAQQRAMAVRHALEANGVPPVSLVLDRPVAAPSGDDPRAAQRVELRLR